MSDPYGQPPSWGQPEQQGDRGYQQPGPPAPTSGYPGSSYPTSGYPAPDPWGPPQSPGYPPQSYPPQSPGYPPQRPGYPAQQPGYPAPSSGGPYQAYPQDQAYPQAYGAPPPPRRSRGPVIAAIVIVVIVLCVGIGGAIALLGSKGNRSTPAAGTSGATAGTGSTTAPSTAPASSTVKLVAPDRIGVLQKTADQSQANSILSQMSEVGIEHPFSVGYEDTANKGRLAIAWGGTGQIFTIGGPRRQLDSFFSSAGKSLSGGTVGARHDIDPGSAGGVAQCAPVTGLGVAMALCAWVGGDGLLGVNISGLAADKADVRMHDMLQAIVTKG